MFRFWRRRKPVAESLQIATPTVYISEALISHSTGLLKQSRDERSAHEGILYWAGKSFGERWFLTTCIAPPAVTTKGSYRTTSRANAEVIKVLAKNQLELLAQVHSHPGTYVDHSDGDNEGALMPYENFLSIVVPFYGHDGILPLNRCGVHRYEGAEFVRLSNEEVDGKFVVIPDAINLRNV